MELDSVHEAYKKELERVCEKHQIELNETEQRHRNEIQNLCADNLAEINNLKHTLKSLYEIELDKIKNDHEYEVSELKNQIEKRLNDLKDCDLDTLTKRIEDDITKAQTKHKKIVSYLVNEIYKLKKTIISSSFDDIDRLSSFDSFDPKLFRNNLNGHDTDIETSDYVLSQDSIDMQIKDLEDIVQERDDLRSVAMTLRQLSKYLCTFLMTKQEELNNSIVECMNVMECGGISNGDGSGDCSAIESKNKYEHSVNETRSPRRVHFVPNIEEIVSLIDENSVLADFTNTEGTCEETDHLKLNACLEKLNEEAAALSDVIHNEQKLICLNSEDICHKTFFDKKLDYYKKELEKQKSDYKKLFKQTFTLEQENTSLKEQLQKETSSVEYIKQCNDVENDNLILLQQKAQELIKNFDDWPNLQNVFDEYFTESKKIIDNIRNEKDDLAQQLIVADRRLKASQKFLKDQMAERETERDEFDSKLETLKCQLNEKKRESLDTEDLRSHTEQIVIEAEQQYLKLENKLLKTEELLNASKLEVQSLKNIIHNMENRIGSLIENEMSQKNSINQLTNMVEEEQNNQQDMLTELDRLRNLLEEQSQSGDCPEFADIEIIINKIRFQLKDVEQTISKRIKDLDTFWISEECGSPMSEDISVAERCELPNVINIEKNSSPARIVATLDDVFIRLQERLSRLFKSEDAIFKHESDQQINSNKLNKQIKTIESEVDMLRSRLAEKSDQLTTAKMKIDELRVLKNDNVNSATSQLQEKLKNLTTEHKQCSKTIEEQSHETQHLKDSINYLKNILSVYESKLAEKENIDPNTINNLESKVIHLAEENMNLQIELSNKVSQVEALSTQVNKLKSQELSQNIGVKQNRSISKSVMTDTHISENEQMRRAIPNESKSLASMQMSYHHQDSYVNEPSMINLSLPSPSAKNNINIHDSLSDELKSSLANAKLELEEKNALIKVMEKDAEHMDQQLRELKEIIQKLNSEKNTLENHNSALIENEIILADKLNNVITQLEKKQETLTELETLGVKLRAEIQPLEYMKDNLEKKILAFKDCNRIQSERIKCLENMNEELINECDRLKQNQKYFDEIKSLQQDNWTLKNELLNTEKFKVELTDKMEKLKNKYDDLISTNSVLKDDIENLKLDKERLKTEIEKNEEWHSEELLGYRNLLAEEQNKKHNTNMELLKTIEELTNQTSEHQKLLSDFQENKELEVTCSFSDIGSENIVSNTTKSVIQILESNLECEQKKLFELKRNIEDKNAEIEHLNTMTKFQEEKILDYIKIIKDESDRSTELQLIIIQLENHIKELENKLEISKAKELSQANDGLVEKLENDLAKVLDTNEMLDNELTRVLDIKEEMDLKLIEAYQKIDEFQTYKNKLLVVLEQLESKNKIIETLKLTLSNAETKINNQQAHAVEEKRVFDLKILEYRKELKDSEQKYNEIVNDYEVIKKYLIKKQQTTEDVQLITGNNDNLKLKLEEAEKNSIEWQKKYNDLLHENQDIKNKFENLDAECGHLHNKMTELQNKLTLSDCYKNRLKSDIQDITKPIDLEFKNSKLIINLETENVTLTRKLTETREKYKKCRTHLEEIKTMLTNQNLKTIVQDNIDLCNTRDDLQKEISDLKSRYQELSEKLLEKSENYWPIMGNQHITRIEVLYHSLIWQKLYLVKLARGKDKLLRFIINEWPDLDNSIIKTMLQRICAKRKMSRFKIVAICVIAARRMRMTTIKYVQPRLDFAQSHLDFTHYSLPRKMPWIKC